MSLAAEERENIQAVIRHIQSETCIEFRDITDTGDTTENSDDDENTDTRPLLNNNRTSLNENKTISNLKDTTDLSNDERQSDNEIGKSDNESEHNSNNSVPSLERTSKTIVIHVSTPSRNHERKSTTKEGKKMDTFLLSIYTIIYHCQ